MSRANNCHTALVDCIFSTYFPYQKASVSSLKASPLQSYAIARLTCICASKDLRGNAKPEQMPNAEAATLLKHSGF